MGGLFICGVCFLSVLLLFSYYRYVIYTFIEYISQFKNQTKLGEVILVTTESLLSTPLLSQSSQASVSLDVRWA